MGEIAGLFGEYVNGIREVQSFSLESVVTTEIAEMLKEQILIVAKKAALFRGISAGSVQLIQLGVYALAFYIGARLMDEGILDFESFNLVLWSMAFGASGMGYVECRYDLFGSSMYAELTFNFLLSSQEWRRTGFQLQQKARLPPYASSSCLIAGPPSIQSLGMKTDLLAMLLRRQLSMARKARSNSAT